MDVKSPMDEPLKVMTVLGTRPEIIRLSRIIPKLDMFCNHILVHTEQSFDANMSQVFFDELNIRQPDYFLGVQSETFASQVGKVFSGIEELLTKLKPDRLLVLGDTNSALSAFVAKRMGVPVYHMEAGNRCFDDRVPEEVNRRVIDHCADIHLPYTERSRDNLLREGIAGNRIYVVGNPIKEVLDNYKASSHVLNDLGLIGGEFYLVTVHRQETVEHYDRLVSLLSACSKLTAHYPVIFSCHPRTRHSMENMGLLSYPSITFHEPFGFADFLMLSDCAACVITDSGTVQEECNIRNIRCVTVRDTTERPETVECGSNIISGVETASILRCVKLALVLDYDWQVPPEYAVPNVSDRVVKIIMGVS